MRRDAHVAGALIHAAEKATAGVAEHQTDQRQGANFSLDGLHDLIHARQANPLGRGDIDFELGFVDVGRNVFLPDHLIERHLTTGMTTAAIAITMARWAIDQASMRS